MSEKDTRWDDALEAIRAGREEMRKKRALRVVDLEAAAARHRVRDQAVEATKREEDARKKADQSVRPSPTSLREWRPTSIPEWRMREINEHGRRLLEEIERHRRDVERKERDRRLTEAYKARG